MKYTLEQLNKMVEDSNGGGLWLDGLTSIPEGFNPTVGGSLWLDGVFQTIREKSPLIATAAIVLAFLIGLAL